jgi:hypothetical protein
MLLCHGRRKCDTHPLMHMFKLSDQKMTDVTAEQVVNTTTFPPHGPASTLLLMFVMVNAFFLWQGFTLFLLYSH